MKVHFDKCIFFEVSAIKQRKMERKAQFNWIEWFSTSLEVFNKSKPTLFSISLSKIHIFDITLRIYGGRNKPILVIDFQVNFHKDSFNKSKIRPV